VRGHRRRSHDYLLGGSEACIEVLGADRELEAMRVSVDQDITCGADTVNPEPSGPVP
jgi:hypothetical protein